MRFPHSHVAVLLGFLVAGCGPATPTQPGESAAASPSMSVEAADSACTLSLHAILREAGSDMTFGQIQFRIAPPEAGSSDATVDYRGGVGPVDDRDYTGLRVAIVSRIPAQTPTWSDVDKSDPGTTVEAVLRFGRVASMSQAMALALVDEASSFKAVVNVVGTTGGREAEGLVEPSRSAPESLRERQRVCFGGG